MSRRSSPAKREILPDPVYNSVTITKFINVLMERGKKSTAERILYGALEIVAKKSGEEAIEAFAGSDIQTNPPATNEAVARSERAFTRQVDQLPPAGIVNEIDRLVDMDKLEATLMAEGIAKFANPQKALLAMVTRKRSST